MSLLSPKITSAAIRLVACAFLATLISCAAGPRKADDVFIPPPLDPGREEWEADLDLVREQPIPDNALDDYQIGPGDVVSITMLGRPDVFGEDGSSDGTAVYTVSDNPLLILPYVGAVNVHGKTTEQLESELRTAYSEVIKDPVPVVSIREYSSNFVSVLGGVMTPGRYPLESDDTLLEAIFKAGGLSFGREGGTLPPAQILKIYRQRSLEETFKRGGQEAVLERMENRNTIESREEIIIPLDEFIVGGDLSYNIPLRTNDIIYIPPAGTCVVHGQVRNPRVVFLGPGLRTVSQVLVEVGNLKYRAASIIEIVRVHPDGTVETFYLNGRKIRDRRARDFVLRDNDQVFVYTNNFRAFLDILGSIFRASANTGVNATYSPTP